MKTILPSNSTDFERAADLAAARRLEGIPVARLATLFNPATCPLSVIEWIAWSFGVETWKNGMTEQEKRAAVSAAIEIASHRGTSDAQGATPVEIKVSEISSGEFTVERNDKFQGVKARWHSTEDAALHEVCVGKGEPYDTLKDEYDSEESARLAAENRLAEMRRAAKKAELEAAADMRVCAEGFVKITGTPNALVAGIWRTEKVEFTCDRNGLKMKIYAGY